MPITGRKSRLLIRSPPNTPWAKSSPLIRLTCCTRSPTSVLRSRQTRRRSSSRGVGALAMEQTRGSPRLKAIRVRTRVSPSIRSVFARRRRREVRIDAASTTWLSIPSDCSTRWIQKPSRPASWMTIIGKSLPVRAVALRLSSANRRSSPDTSPAGTECLDIFSPPPGDRDVISQVLRDSSIETKIAPRSVRIAACTGRGVSSGIVASRVGGSATSLSKSADRYPDAHGICRLLRIATQSHPEGEPIANVDYGQLFPRLAYLEAGHLPPDGDLYDITGGGLHREGWKQLLNALLLTGKRLGNWPEGARGTFPPGTTLRDVVHAISERHAPIAHLFGCGVGIRLMRLESEMLIATLCGLFERGVTSLPLHDSVLVAES